MDTKKNAICYFKVRPLFKPRISVRRTVWVAHAPLPIGCLFYLMKRFLLLEISHLLLVVPESHHTYEALLQHMIREN